MPIHTSIAVVHANCRKSPHIEISANLWRGRTVKADNVVVFLCLPEKCPFLLDGLAGISAIL